MVSSRIIINILNKPSSTAYDAAKNNLSSTKKTVRGKQDEKQVGHDFSGK